MLAFICLLLGVLIGWILGCTTIMHQLIYEPNETEQMVNVIKDTLNEQGTAA